MLLAARSKVKRQNNIVSAKEEKPFQHNVRKAFHKTKQNLRVGWLQYGFHAY